MLQLINKSLKNEFINAVAQLRQKRRQQVWSEEARRTTMLKIEIKRCKP